MRKLRPYQRSVLHRYAKENFAALFFDMRLGKTLPSIRLCNLWETRSVLIVCPYAAFQSWREETEQENKKLIELTGKKEQRLELLKLKSDFHIINKEGFLTVPEIRNYNWDCIILDESTFIKNPLAKVTKFFLSNFDHVQKRIILTGTPAPESELEYYCQLKFIRQMPIKNYWEFKAQFFITMRHDTFISTHGEGYLKSYLKKCMFLSRKDAGINVEKIYQRRIVKSNKKFRGVYKKLKKEFLLDVDNVEVFTKWATHKFILLRRLCGGFADTEFVFDMKLNELLYLLQTELKNEQVIVWVKFIAEGLRIADSLSSLSVGNMGNQFIYGKVSPQEREHILSDFKKQEFRILIAQPEVAKHGLNLGYVDTAIYYSTPESLETRMQSEDRIVTVAKKSVLIIDLLMEHSVDIQLNKSIQKKENKSTAMKNMVKYLQHTDEGKDN